MFENSILKNRKKLSLTSSDKLKTLGCQLLFLNETNQLPFQMSARSNYSFPFCLKLTQLNSVLVFNQRVLGQGLGSLIPVVFIHFLIYFLKE